MTSSSGETRVRRLEPRAGLAGASRRLAEALEGREVRRGALVRGAGYLRVEQPLDPVDPIPWLRAQAPLPRFYWGARDHTLTLAGAGIAEEVEGEAFDALPPLLERAVAADGAQGTRVFLSARFDLTRTPDPEWMVYKRVYAQLPLLELNLGSTDCRLAVNLKAGAALRSGGFDAQRRTAVRALGRVRDIATRTGDPVCLQVNDNGARDVWTRRVEGLLERIESGDLGKAVLAHRTTLEAAETIDPLGLVSVLRSQDPAAFHYLLQPTPETAFVGASPERLYRRQGRRLRTEALAGTCPRGRTAREDVDLGKSLLGSAKDGLEHSLVRDHIRARLAPLCEHVDEVETPELQRMRHVQHLRTPLGARLRPAVGDADLLEALHPTPAVCGLPTEAARTYIRRVEPFDRGLYSGPLGVLGAGVSECAVAIRSALIQGREVQLFAGAGIVEGSDPDAEWEETIGKMRLFEAILKAGHGA